MAQRIFKVLRHFTQICAYGAGRGSFLGPAFMSVLQDMMSYMSVLQDMMTYMSVLQDMMSYMSVLPVQDMIITLNTYIMLYNYVLAVREVPCITTAAES